MSYQYWASDRISETTLPTTRRVVECIDARLRVTWASATKTLSDCTGNTAAIATDAYFTNAEYTAHGAPQRWQLGNGLYEVSKYNDFLQLERKRIGANPNLLQTCGTATDDQLCLEWAYGASANNGNITESRQWARKTAGGYLNLLSTFGYDGRNRLTTFNESVVSGGTTGGTWGQTNNYDRYGNRWATSTGVTQSDWTPTQQSNFDAAKNQITTAKNGASTAPVTNDLAGYMTVHPQVAGTMVYDAEGRLLSGGGATYTYDGEGRRIKRVAAGFTYWYWYGADGGLIGEDTPEQIETGVQYLSTDALGSTRLVTKASQEVAARIDYWPFGEEIVASSSAGNRDLVSGYGGAAALKQRFTGKERDPEMGFDYFGARYLSSAQGRFTSPDEWQGGPVDPFTNGQVQQAGPLPYADIQNPQSLNKYAYVMNNPPRYTDPDGHCVGALAPICMAGNTPVGQRVGSFVTANTEKLIVGALAITSAATSAVMDAHSKYGVGTPDFQGGPNPNANFQTNATHDPRHNPSQADIVVGEKGTAMPVDKNRLEQGFRDAGIPSKTNTQTKEGGTVYEVPTQSGTMPVRVMPGSSKNPPRVVFGTKESPRNVDGVRPKQGQEKNESHIPIR